MLVHNKASFEIKESKCVTIFRWDAVTICYHGSQLQLYGTCLAWEAILFNYVSLLLMVRWRFGAYPYEDIYAAHISPTQPVEGWYVPRARVQ